MRDIYFTFHGREYSGSLLSSLDITPHYHWFILRQPELRELLGDEIAFVVKDATLRPVNPFLAQKNRELFQQISIALEAYLFNKQD